MNFSDDTLRYILESVELVNSECSALAYNCNERPLYHILTIKVQAYNCNERPLYHILMGPACLVLTGIALFGNAINILIYRSNQIRHYSAIRMLSAKLTLNTLFMLCLLPQALRLTGYFDRRGQWEHRYWAMWPFQSYAVNVFGFCAMWLTVLMIAECYAHVFHPSQSKSLCSGRTLARCYLLIGFFALLLPLTYPLNRVVHLQECHGGEVRVQISVRAGWWLAVWEQLSAAAGLILAIALPLTLLIYMTGALSWRLLLKPPMVDGQTHFASKKRAVIRITLLTTVLTETPAIPVYIYVTAFGPGAIQHHALCLWQTVAHFLSLCNASLSFFVYVALSHRFRHLLVAYDSCNGSLAIRHFSVECKLPVNVVPQWFR